MIRKPAKANRLVPAFQRLGPTTQRAVIAALVVLAVHGATGVSLVALVAGGVLVLILLHRPAPPPSYEPSREQLDRIDRARAQDEEDEYAASGAGELVYEQSMKALHALVGQRVTVHVGTAERPIAMLEGTLIGAQDSAFSTDDEVLLFLVGAEAAFYVDRRQLVAPYAEIRRYGEEGIELVGADGSRICVDAGHTERT